MNQYTLHIKINVSDWDKVIRDFRALAQIGTNEKCSQMTALRVVAEYALNCCPGVDVLDSDCDETTVS